MISIIISSYQQSFFNTVSLNIKATVGCEYEIIKIDNPGLMGICAAYNLGAVRAKYENLLFVHEDVQFLTSNWGTNLINLLSDGKVGIVGVAGSDYIPNCPSGWYNAGKNNYLNIEQYDTSKFISSSRIKHNIGSYLLDGVFLGMKAAHWQVLKFNENLTGFHGYDIDISARSAQMKDNLVTGEIVLRHFSPGKADEKWFTALLAIRGNYTKPKSQKINKDLEIKSYNQFLYGLGQLSNKFKIVYYSLKYLNPKFIGLVMSFKYLKIIVYTFIFNKPIWNGQV